MRKGGGKAGMEEVREERRKGEESTCPGIWRGVLEDEAT